MRALYFDTETTGIIPKGMLPLAAAPHIVQLAARVVCSETGELHTINAIIRPDGWEIPAGAAAVHGITTEKALAVGLPGRVVMALFSNLCRVADLTVAHNADFDLAMVAFEMERLGAPNVSATLPNVCTMMATKDLCKIPGRFGDYKWPKLMEAYQHLFGETFDGAHDAMADRKACQRIHEHLTASPNHE